MPNAYTPDELQTILSLSKGLCYTHTQAVLQIQDGPRGGSEFLCPVGHTSSPEYYAARALALTVESATEDLRVLLGRADLVSHEEDFRWFPLELAPITLHGFVEGGDDYWASRGVSAQTRAAFRTGTYLGVPAVPFYDFQGGIIGFFTRNPEVPPDTPYQKHDVKCAHLPTGPLHWESYKLHVPPMPRPAAQDFVVVVEGICDVMACMDAGYWACATNGSRLSYTQVAELRTMSRNILVLTDADPSGKVSHKHPAFLAAVFPFFTVKVLEATGAKDPGSMSTEDLKNLLDSVVFP